jgi:hypothetical protein
MIGRGNTSTSNVRVQDFVNLATGGGKSSGGRTGNLQAGHGHEGHNHGGHDHGRLHQDSDRDVGKDVLIGVVSALPGLLTPPSGDHHPWDHGDHHPDHWHDYDHHHHPHWTSRPVFVEREPVIVTSANEPATISTKANAAPKQIDVKTVANLRGEGNSLTKAEYDAAADAVNQQAKEKVAAVIGDLGQTVNDKPVADLIKEAQDAADKGIPLSPDWEQRLTDAVNNSPNKGTIAPTFAQTVSDFVNVQNANVLLTADWDPGVTCFPTGDCECIMMPCLPADDFCMIRPNCCMVGTGGEGCIGVVSCDAAELVNMPYGAGEPQSETSMDYTQAVTNGVLIINPAENDTEISFVLDNESYSLKPGFSRNFTDEDSWEVRFNRGESSKDARYTIEPGTYVFTPGDSGWDLFRRTINVTIENRGDQVFNYVAGDEPIELKSGEALEHSSIYPFFIRFDRGDGQDAVKRFVDKKSELSVAVDPKIGVLDLFPANQLASAELESDKVASESGARTALFNSINAKPAETASAGASRSARLMALMKGASKPAAKPAAAE